MFFKISKESMSSSQAILDTLACLGEVRTNLTAVGVSNDKIFSDSISIQKKTCVYVNGLLMDPHEAVDSDDDSEDGKRKKKKTEKEYCEVFTASVIIRIQLDVGEPDENETDQSKSAKSNKENKKLFGKVMACTMRMGITNCRAPLYETTELTLLRQEARQNAAKNATEKANIIAASLGTGTKIGSPISVIDCHCDVDDDSSNNFVSSFNGFWDSFKLKKKVDGTEEKDAMETIPNSLMEQMDDLFVPPTICVKARVKVVFEIVV